jgi:hypothetical protein
VWILQGVDPIEYALKKGFPMPNADEFKKMCSQGWTILGQISTNQAMYGKTEYVIISLEKLYGFLIPIDQRHYMGISCAKPCNPLAIIANVSKVLAEGANAC